jgi:hypothetical protein
MSVYRNRENDLTIYHALGYPESPQCSVLKYAAIPTTVADKMRPTTMANRVKPGDNTRLYI